MEEFVFQSYEILINYVTYEMNCIKYHVEPKPNTHPTTMTSNPAIIYAPLQPDPDNQNYVVLPLYNYSPTRRRNLRRYLTYSVVLILLLAAGYLLYPSDPELSLVRLRLNHIELCASSLTLSLSLRIRNRDFFSLRYSSLDIAIGYRGQNLGHAMSDGGLVRARGTSYVNATLDLDGFQVIHDLFHLIDDLARGSVPFDTDSVVDGDVGLFFLQVPIKARIWCEVHVDTKKHTIIHQDCYPKR